MNMQLITNEMIVNAFGDRHDGIQVFKNNKSVGFLTDLRVTLARNFKKKLKQKEYSNRVAEARRDAMPDAVQEMLEFLENQLSKYDARVFINETQPNVHINDCKCYIIVDPIYGKHRLGIYNPNKEASEMAEEVEQCFKISSSDALHHILINSMSRDDIVEAIVKLCK